MNWHLDTRGTLPYDKQSKRSQIIIAAAIFLTASTLGMIARFVSAKMKSRRVGLSELLLIFAFVVNVAETGIILWAVDDEGFGRHKSSLSKDQLTKFEKAYFTCSLLQPPLLMASKISVLVLLYQIFVTRPFRITVITLTAIVLAWWVTAMLGGSLICQPVKSYWDPNTPGHCGNSYIFDLILPLPWIVTDFAILVAPLPVIRKLHTPTRQKVMLSALFLVGGMTCIISCVRYRYSFWTTKDATWDTIPLFICQLAEAHMTVLCACLIACKAVAMYLVPDNIITKLRSYVSTRSRSYPRMGNEQQQLSSDEHLYPCVELDQKVSHPQAAVGSTKSIARAEPKNGL